MKKKLSRKLILGRVTFSRPSMARTSLSKLSSVKLNSLMNKKIRAKLQRSSFSLRIMLSPIQREIPVKFTRSWECSKVWASFRGSCSVG